MVSRENTVIVACLALAIPLAYLVGTVETLPSWAGTATLLFAGVVVPIALNEYLDRHRTS